jgi:MoxR-like ATPase
MSPARTSGRKQPQAERPAAAPAPPAGRELPSLLTRPLGLLGWSALEPVVLAALASGEPMLLVGRHGTAKSFLLERLAQALELSYRFYNASLLCFDDLVGVPVPDESGRGLRYLATPEAIWGAEVLFVDEISRCRPDVANKLFPLVHERRVQGVLVESLRYRWAAMNPPPAPDGDEDEAYLGAEPLDPALADRFTFLIEVPAWEALSADERSEVLLDQFRGRHPFPVQVPALVAQAERLLAALQRAVPARLVSYVVALADARAAAGQPPYSARRATALLRSALAVHAARLVLLRCAEPQAPPAELDWEASAWLAVLHGDPELARRGTLDRAALLALHRQAWKLSGLDAADPWRELLATPDPLERALRAIELPGFGPDELTPLVLDGLAAEADPALRTATALALYLALLRGSRVHATAFEVLARDVRRVLAPAERNLAASPHQAGLAREVGALTAQLQQPDLLQRRARDAYARNLLEALLPDGYGRRKPASVLQRFTQLWDRLRLDERTAAEAAP